MSRDFLVVAVIVLVLGLILQQAILGHAVQVLEEKLDEIYENAEQNGGWVLIRRKD